MLFPWSRHVGRGNSEKARDQFQQQPTNPRNPQSCVLFSGNGELIMKLIHLGDKIFPLRETTSVR